MKRIALAVVVMLLLGACSALPLIQSLTQPTASVDIAGTSQADLQVSAAQTLTAQPTSTSLPPTATTEALIASPALFSTDTPASSSITVAPTETQVTATFDIATSTNIPATLPFGSATVTPTLGVLTYGTLPPAIPFSQITLINRSKRQAYISLQVVTAEGGPTIIEYPVKAQVKIKAPLGHYLYVAWVGGKEMVGEFRLHNGEDLSIILYQDKVEIH